MSAKLLGPMTQRYDHVHIPSFHSTVSDAVATPTSHVEGIPLQRSTTTDATLALRTPSSTSVESGARWRSPALLKAGSPEVIHVIGSVINPDRAADPTNANNATLSNPTSAIGPSITNGAALPTPSGLGIDPPSTSGQTAHVPPAVYIVVGLGTLAVLGVSACFCLKKNQPRASAAGTSTGDSAAAVTTSGSEAPPAYVASPAQAADSGVLPAYLPAPGPQDSENVSQDIELADLSAVH